MDIKLIMLLEDIKSGYADTGKVADFLARFSWQLSRSSLWEDVAVTSELEYLVAEIQAGMEHSSTLSSFAEESLARFTWRKRPASVEYPLIADMADARKLALQRD